MPGQRGTSTTPEESLIANEPLEGATTSPVNQATSDVTTAAERATSTIPQGQNSDREAADLPAVPQQPTTAIEADDGVASDDGYETGSESSSNASTSISSSIRDYNFENRRRYHKFKEGRYVFPNDEPEQEREDMKHCMVVGLCDGGLHNAPLRDPQKILDIGTGTGIWAIDSAYGLTGKSNKY